MRVGPTPTHCNGASMNRTTTLLALSVAALGCASAPPRAVRHSYVYATDRDPASGHAVNIGQVDMLPGETFTGSYHSQQLGDLFLEQNGMVVTGTYQYDRAACRSRGRLQGRTAGNLLRFTWTEDQSLCGRFQPITGHGYMLFWMERNDDGAVNGRLDGEWGMGDAELGNGHWSAFRDRVRRDPPPELTAPPTQQRGVFEDGAAAPR
jgi:hypothetical protein